MRILMVVPQMFYSTRGTPLSAYHRTRELQLMGQQVDILAYPVGAEPPDPRVRVYRSRGPHFTSRIKAGPSYAKIWFDALLFINLIVRLARHRYDCLYAHEEAAFMCRLAGAVFRTPYIYDMHSSLPLQIVEWEFSRKRWVVSLFRWIERFSVRGARAIVAISPAVADAAKAADPNASVVTIVNFFGAVATATSDEAAAIRSRYDIARDAPLIVYTGSFVPLQALDMLLDAMPALLERLPSARLLMVGGTQAELDEYRLKVSSRGLDRCVALVESRPQSEMPSFMAAADVLVSPRIRGINPPGKLFSYLASGRPVVAADTLVHNQLISPKSAFLYRPTSGDLTEALLTALTDKRRAAEIVAGAGAFIADYCSETARKQAYDALIALISSRGAPPAGRSDRREHKAITDRVPTGD